MKPAPKRRPRVLCIDDEVSVLNGLRRTLRNLVEVVPAVGGEEGLRLLRKDGPFPIVVCDMRMPGLSGAEVLETFRKQSPDTVRILLTGYTDINGAIAAVNKGSIFRFLTKPCATPDLVRALRAAIKQHELQESERVLLQHTLVGCIKTLSDVLAMASPAAFGRGTRARRLVHRLTAHLGRRVQWEVEAAALLSQIGAVTLPESVVDKLYRGRSVSDEERRMAERVPGLAGDLLANIPRLEPVRLLLKGIGLAADEQPEPPQGSLMLTLALDFDELETQMNDPLRALETLRGRGGRYDPELLDAFAEMLGQESRREVRELELRDLRAGMVLAEDMHSTDGVLMMARGQEINLGLLERVWNFTRRVKVVEPLRVYAPRRATEAKPRRSSSRSGGRRRAAPRSAALAKVGPRSAAHPKVVSGTAAHRKVGPRSGAHPKVVSGTSAHPKVGNRHMRPGDL